MMVVTT